MDSFEHNGFLNIFKPVGMTSHDVVSYVKRRIHAHKVGHGGTLDPAACGVLVILINKGAKLSDRVMHGRKHYRFEMTFGLQTDTGDVQGNLLKSDTVIIPESDITGVLSRFVGEIQQMPPMASAIKINGRRLYKSAHKGETVERPPRNVTIHELHLVDSHVRNGRTAALLDMQCSRGTYVRSLVEDVAAALGAQATTTFLMRSASGPFHAHAAVPLQKITPETARHFLLAPEFLDGASDPVLY
jgi:tRNA pseudouridine55 synthase